MKPKGEKWRAEFDLLRKLCLDCGLTEALKWGCPCFTLQGQNIVLIHGFKEYCALFFFKGSLMKDPEEILIQQTENVQAGRQIRFADIEQIVRRENILKNYIHDAIEVEKAGLKVAFKKTAEFAMLEEFSKKLSERLDLKEAFEALTPGRQRAYLLHFSSAKQAKTRETRIEKSLQRILDGKGLLDD